MNNCKHCGNETKNNMYCSRSCAAKETNKIPKRKINRRCNRCNNVVRKYDSSLCEQHYREYQQNKKEALLDLTLADYTNRDSIKRLHKSSKFAHIRGLCRSWNKDLIKLPCHICGYNKHVELAHIKPLSSFPETATLRDVNNRNNIVQLCPNCHWEYDNGFIKLS